MSYNIEEKEEERKKYKATQRVVKQDESRVKKIGEKEANGVLKSSETVKEEIKKITNMEKKNNAERKSMCRKERETPLLRLMNSDVEEFSKNTESSAINETKEMSENASCSEDSITGSSQSECLLFVNESEITDEKYSEAEFGNVFNLEDIVYFSSNENTEETSGESVWSDESDEGKDDYKTVGWINNTESRREMKKINKNAVEKQYSYKKEFSSNFIIKFMVFTDTINIIVDNFNLIHVTDKSFNTLHTIKLDFYRIDGIFEFNKRIFMFSKSSSSFYEIVIDTKPELVEIRGKFKKTKKIEVTDNQLYALDEEGLSIYDKCLMPVSRRRLEIVDFILSKEMKDTQQRKIICIEKNGNILELSSALDTLYSYSYSDRFSYERLFLWDDKYIIVCQNSLKICSDKMALLKEFRNSINLSVFLHTFNNTLYFVKPEDSAIRMINRNLEITEVSFIEKKRFNSINFIASSDNSLFICCGKSVYRMI